MKKQAYCEITEHTEVMPGTMRLTAHDPDIAAAARPGQFVNVLCGPCMDPLLRRPFSIYNVDRARGEFSLFYLVRGRGTVLLSQKEVGEELDVVGPIGRPFDIDPSENVDHILLGGGCGIVPLMFLSDALKEEARGKITVLIGAQSAESILCEREFMDRDLPVEISTDDGTMGRQGLITDLLIESLDKRTSNAEPRIYACGPHGMLKAVARIADARNVKCQMSLEAAMACGIGVCMGCVVKTRDESGQQEGDWNYKRVCVDGPVFYSTELVWE